MTDKEIGPRTVKLALLLIKFMKYGIVTFLLYEYLEKSPNCITTKHSSLIINLNEQQTYTVVECSDLAKNGIFAHLSSPVFLYPTPRSKKF